MSNALELLHVTKRFGSMIALNDVSHAASERSLIGLVGKNGSGNTTRRSTATKNVAALQPGPCAEPCTTSQISSVEHGFANHAWYGQEMR